MKKKVFFMMVVMLIAVASVFGQYVAKEIKFNPKDVSENPVMEMDANGDFINVSKVGVYNTDNFSNLDMGNLVSYKKFFEFSEELVKTGSPDKAVIYGSMVDSKGVVTMLKKNMVKMEYKNSFSVQFLGIPADVVKIRLCILEEKNSTVIPFAKITKDDGKKQGSSSGASGDGGVSIPPFRP